MTHEHTHGHAQAHEFSIWQICRFSRDHKIIGIQFLISSFLWLIIGGLLALAIRWQLAWPWSGMPIIGKMLFASEGGQISPEFYTMLFTMHGTIMIFVVIIPMMLGAFANFLIPLQIGYKDMAFPTLNMMSYWIMWPGFICFLLSFFVAGGAAAGGWTSYPPLSAIFDAAPGSGRGQTLWILGVTFVGTSSMMGSVNYMTTIINCRAPGMTMFRLPLSTWALFITAILQAFALPVLTAAGFLLLADRALGTTFFVPAGVYVNSELIPDNAGIPLMWQHLFWFYAHPAVYILILPSMGIVSEVISCNSRKPVFGYRPMVYAIAAIAGLGFVVWGHHMYTSGMNPILGLSFMLTTIFIALPSAIKTFNWVATMWGGKLRVTTPMLHAVAFVASFIIGGLSGIIMAATPVDVQIHDTYFIVAHFHYVAATSVLFGIFAGTTHWFPKMFGRSMNETLGRLHFVLTFLFINGTFFAMHQVGAAGMPRRYADYLHIEQLVHLQPLNQMITVSAMGLGLAQLLFIVNFFYSMFHGPKASKNPWHATSLEWSTPSPPPHGNFETILTVYRGPHEYSPPQTKLDFLPQWIAPDKIAEFEAEHTHEDEDDQGAQLGGPAPD
jgi:cytochrome c oxidase subunit 1